MFGNLAISWKIYKLLQGCENLERHPQGDAKRAFEELVALGPKALPALEKINQSQIAEYQTYCEKLKSGPSANPYENYGLRSDAQKQHRHVIEMRQARIVDVIEAIRERHH
jgi:hypothetical protein